MSKVLLVNPPFYRLLGSHYNANSLGIAYIAAVLNENGHDAFLYNADFVDDSTYANLTSLYKNFTNYKSFFSDAHAPIWNEVVEAIIRFDADWVGYTSYTANISAIDIISQRVALEQPGIKQVVGGTHATLDKAILDKLPAIDYAVSREGEYVMLDLVNGSNPELIPGVASRHAAGIVHNGDAETLDIDSIPFPERDRFWNLSDSQKQSVDVSYVVSIRGCPYRCNYCASPYSWKRGKTQFRGVDSIMSELHHLKTHYWSRDSRFDYSASPNIGPKRDLIIADNSLLYFVDDVFTVRKKRVKTLLRRMIDEGIDKPWKCEARTDHLDEEICQLLADAGCVRVKLGFESGSDRILKSIQKDETTEDMRRGAKMLKDAGVPFTAYFMAGFPQETDEDLRATISLAREIKADFYSLSILSPYYGTKLYFDMLDQGHALDKAPWEYFFHQAGQLMVNNQISDSVIKEYLSLNELNPGAGYI